MNKWFYFLENGRAIGPLKLSDLRERAARGELGPYQLIYSEVDHDWRPALAFAELKGYFKGGDPVDPSQWVVLRRLPEGRLAVEKMGPFSSSEIQKALDGGQLEFTDYVWREGMHQWRRIALLKEFSPKDKTDFSLPPNDQPKLPTPEEITETDYVVFLDQVDKNFETKKEPPPPEAVGPDLAELQLLPQQEIPPQEAASPETPPQTQGASSAIPTPPAVPEEVSNRAVRNAARAIRAKANRETRRQQKEAWSIWRQIFILAILVIAVAYKLFVVDEVKLLPPPPPPPPPPVAVTPPPPLPPPVERHDVPEVETPAVKRPPRVVKHPLATRLRIRIGPDTGQGASVSVETDAPPEQFIWLEVVGLPGQLTDHSHFYKRVKWSSAKPLDILNGEISAGLYVLRAESKRRLQVPELDKMSREDVRKMIFQDLWRDLLEFYKSAPTNSPDRNREGVQAFINKVSMLSVWRT